MRNFKIFQIIFSFSEEELKDFENFILSPYLIGSRDYSRMLKTIYLLNNNRDKLREISNEEFYSGIFPGKSYNNKTLRNRLNELTKLAEKFLIHKSLEKDGPLNSLLLLKELKNRNLSGLFKGEFEKVNSSPDVNSSKSFIIDEINLLSISHHKEHQDFNKMFEEFKKQTDYLIIYFLERFFEMMIEYETEKQYGINPRINIADDLIENMKADKFIQVLEKRNDVSYLMIILYYYLYKSSAEVYNEEAYKKFSSVFFKNLDNLSDEQKNEFFGYMISRYLVYVNSGKPEYLKEVFKLYNIKLKLGLHSELKILRYPSSAYRDYVVVGLRLKKYKWVENFIEKYSGELPPEIKDDEILMAYARLYFEKKEFAKAVEMLNKAKSNNHLFKLDVSRLKLRILFEISDFEEAFMEIDRLRHYIKYNSKYIARSVIRYTKEYIEIFISLLKLKLNPDKKALGFFMNTIKESATLAAKGWFIEKINEIKKAG